jgi:hypothetical protein
MPRKKYEPGQRDTELLEKLLVIQLHTLGARQDYIARVVGRSKVWVNGILKGIPKKKGAENG